MKTKAFALTLILMLVVCSTALAQSDNPTRSESLVLTDEQQEYPLGLYLEILEDPSGELTIEDVTSPQYDAQFVPSQVDVPNYGFTDSAYWVRLPLDNESPLTERWLLEVGFANSHFVDLYTPLPDGGGFDLKQTGVLRPPETREVLHPRIILNLTVPYQSQQTYYLRFQNGASMTLPLILWTPTAFSARSLQVHVLHAFYFGALIALLFYNLFLFFSLREASYLYLIIFLASMILMDSAYEGYVESYLAPDLYYLKPYYIPLSFALTFVSMHLFADSFLELKTAYPRLHWLSFAMVGSWGMLILLIPLTTYHIIATLMAPWSAVSMVAVLAIGLTVWLRGFRQARLFVGAWLGLLCSFVGLEAVRLGLIPSTLLTENAFRLGILWMGLCLSLALADRINLLKKATEVANLALRHSEHRLSQILEGLPLGVVVYGRDQKPNYFNRRVSEILGNPARGNGPDLSAGRTLAKAAEYFSFRVVGTERDYPVEDMPVFQALRGAPASADDIEANLVDKQVPLEVWASPVKNDDGEVESAVVAFQDITRRRRTESELAEYRNHLEASVEELAEYRNHLEALVEERTAQLDHEAAERKVLADIQARLIKWLSAINEIQQQLGGTARLPQAHEQLLVAIRQLLGAKSTFIGMWDKQSDQIEALTCLCPADSPELMEMIPIACEAGSSLHRVIEQGKLLILPNDDACPTLAPLASCLQDEEILSAILAPFGAPSGGPKGGSMGLLGLGMPRPTDGFAEEEIALFVRIESDLTSLAEYARLNDAASELVASEERNRLARDLHDSVTQVLFSASVIAETIPQVWGRDPEKGLEGVEGLRRLTRSALAEMRTLLLELRPASLAKTSLPELLTQLTEAITARSALPFRLFVEQVPPLPDKVHISFYRIAQESLNNVIKHAQASQVTVSLNATSTFGSLATTSNQRVSLMIADDGVGFSNEGQKPEHMGLGIMNERAAAIGAELSIDSHPDHGTKVTLNWGSESGFHSD